MNAARVVAAAVVVFVLALPTAAMAQVTRTSQDLTGFVLVCDTHTYTVISGSLEITERREEDGSGHVGVRAAGVRALDEDGNVYSFHGAQVSNASVRTGEFAITDVFAFQIVGRGSGRTDTLSGVFLIRPPEYGEFIPVEGTCQLP